MKRAFKEYEVQASKRYTFSGERVKIPLSYRDMQLD